ERRYFNVAAGLQNVGAHSDLFGSANGAVPVFVPTLNDFVLFGTASDTSQLNWGVNGALGGSMTVPSNQTGLYQWVAELRDAAGKRVLARSNAMYSHIEESVNVSGTIAANTTWTRNKRYVLNDFVGVASPATLTIEPGTVVYGGTTRATLFIQRGAKIVADGTARRPIIFTSPQRVGSRARADWGSLVLLGSAPINVTGGTAVLEGLPSEPAYTYGGTNAADSSGVLRYVRLEFGGFEIQTNQEINGLTLGGVGNGTVLDYIEVLHNKDDGFEFFGGSVNAKHLLGVAIYDDALDFDFGYSGSIQFAAFVKRASSDEGDSNILIESDNGNPNFDLLPRTNPLVYNITAVRESSTQGNFGAVLRRGTAGRIHNAIVLNSRRAAVTLRDSSTFGAAATGELVLDHSIFSGDFSDAAFTTSDRAADTRTFLFTTMTRNRNADPLLAIGTPTLIASLMPDLAPRDGSPALDAAYVAVPPDNGFLETVDFIGAVGPGDNWILTGWANFSDN
ncbi:MAG TPA: hypothetical protein VEU30_00590, partial [Thermoanaerobaculia bacterium]|nr:hypothetical protein [Thermoanaerobaculia bacterium]